VIHCEKWRHANKLESVVLSGFYQRDAIASAGIGCRRVSVRPSVTSRCSTETAKRRITQTTPHDSPATRVFWCQNSSGVIPTETLNAGGVG